MTQKQKAGVVVDVEEQPHGNGEDAFKKFLEETELDADDEAAIQKRIELFESLPDTEPIKE